MTPLRLTIATRRVLRALLDQGELHGYALGQATSLPSGVTCRILGRLEQVGYVASRWEDVDTKAAGRPARKYVALTAAGRAWARSRGVE